MEQKNICNIREWVDIGGDPWNIRGGIRGIYRDQEGDPWVIFREDLGDIQKGVYSREDLMSVVR